jgi:hypothetical protein
VAQRETAWNVDVLRVARLCKLDASARALFTTGMQPRDYIDVLAAGDRVPDAIRFLACLLPPRKSVWWGCLCAWNAYRDTAASEVELDALDAAAEWVLEPNDAHRRSAETAGQAADLDNPAGPLATVAGWSGEELTSGENAEPPGLWEHAGRAVSGSIFLSAATTADVAGESPARRFLDWGIEVAETAEPWASPEPAEAAHDAGPEAAGPQPGADPPGREP